MAFWIRSNPFPVTTILRPPLKNTGGNEPKHVFLHGGLRLSPSSHHKKLVLGKYSVILGFSEYWYTAKTSLVVFLPYFTVTVNRWDGTFCPRYFPVLQVICLPNDRLERERGDLETSGRRAQGNTSRREEGKPLTPRRERPPPRRRRRPSWLCPGLLL